MWDIVKDDTCNQVFTTVRALRKHMGHTLRRSWEDPPSVLRLIARAWFLAKLNCASTLQRPALVGAGRMPVPHDPP